MVQALVPCYPDCQIIKLSGVGELYIDGLAQGGSKCIVNEVELL